MPIGTRFKALAVLGFTAGAALGAHRLAMRQPADPCDATPDLHACAVFARPDRLTRQAYAGRLPGEAVTRSGPNVETTGSLRADALSAGILGEKPALTVSTSPAAITDQPDADAGADGDGV